MPGSWEGSVYVLQGNPPSALSRLLWSGRVTRACTRPFRLCPAEVLQNVEGAEDTAQDAAAVNHEQPVDLPGQHVLDRLGGRGVWGDGEDNRGHNVAHSGTLDMFPRNAAGRGKLSRAWPAPFAGSNPGRLKQVRLFRDPV